MYTESIVLSRYSFYLCLITLTIACNGCRDVLGECYLLGIVSKLYSYDIGCSIYIIRRYSASN